MAKNLSKIMSNRFSLLSDEAKPTIKPIVKIEPVVEMNDTRSTRVFNMRNDEADKKKSMYANVVSEPKSVYISPGMRNKLTNFNRPKSSAIYIPDVNIMPKKTELKLNELNFPVLNESINTHITLQDNVYSTVVKKEKQEEKNLLGVHIDYADAMKQMNSLEVLEMMLVCEHETIHRMCDFIDYLSTINEGFFQKACGYFNLWSMKQRLEEIQNILKFSAVLSSFNDYVTDALLHEMNLHELEEIFKKSYIFIQTYLGRNLSVQIMTNPSALMQSLHNERMEILKRECNHDNFIYHILVDRESKMFEFIGVAKHVYVNDKTALNSTVYTTDIKNELISRAGIKIASYRENFKILNSEMTQKAALDYIKRFFFSMHKMDSECFANIGSNFLSMMHPDMTFAFDFCDDLNHIHVGFTNIPHNRRVFSNLITRKEIPTAVQKSFLEYEDLYLKHMNIMHKEIPTETWIHI